MTDANGLQADLVVIGGGIAGLSAGAYAARHGATVILVEKNPEIGGNAVLSGGGLWTASSFDAYRELDPKSDPELVRLVVEGFTDAASFIESLGVEIAPLRSTDAIQGYPSHVRVFDNYGYLHRCKAAIEEADGWVVTSAQVERLLVEDGTVVGVEVRDRDGTAEVRAPATVLATGGFQGDPALRRELIGEHAVDVLLRSNPASVGDGLRLARSVGAALNAETDRFYGHLMPAPLGELQPGDFLRLAQIYSPRTLLLDQAGRRLGDESVAYYKNAWMLSRQPDHRALLVADDAVRQFDRTAYGASEQLDRVEEARLAGAHVAEADSLAELARIVAAWGYANVDVAVERFNEAVTAGAELDPPRTLHRTPFTTPPFFAMEVQPAITFTFGGIRADAQMHVVDAAGNAIPGLLAAGVDVGAYHSVYAGGLAFGLVTGLQAAKTALQGASISS